MPGDNGQLTAPGLSRQRCRELQRMKPSDFRTFLVEYSSEMYKTGVEDCLTALHEEFGFGDKRVQKVLDNIARKAGENGMKLELWEDRREERTTSKE